MNRSLSFKFLYTFLYFLYKGVIYEIFVFFFGKIYEILLVFIIYYKILQETC